ncbi:hypothetical protein AIOL_004647 [Candidatus Rhodobacter oscarellae]|uniref:Uncharacterized protein n=1 Tax=Candidatus Rhodobacter oscarellae TaxID=1675527 RepID=A0A0J9EA60_9RHOB|nr:hypothetical protein AIOL_004647 [Candidatus Rhodobacter lobularis]
MKTALKWVAGLLASSIVLFAAMFVGTLSAYPVERLVTDDPSLRSERATGPMRSFLHR